MKAKTLIAAAVGAIMLAGCDVKDPIYNTPHPDHGSITLTTEWNATNIETPPAPACAIRVGACSETLTGVSQTLDYLFEPGDYTIYVHNTTDGIAVNGTMATADYASGGLGWFYTGTQAVTVAKDTDHACTVNMTQQVRELTLVIEPTGGTTERISTITGTLSGVAGSLDFSSGTHGTATTVGFEFCPTAVPEDTNWYATVRLLGVTGASHTLAITVTYNDGSPDEQLESSDLGTLLSGFNDNKREPKTLGAQVVETPTGAGFTATITGWSAVDGNPVIAE